MFVYYVVVKAAVTVCLLFRSASFVYQLWSAFPPSLPLVQVTMTLLPWPGSAETARALLPVLSAGWELTSCSHFKQIPFLITEMTLYPLKITRLCWTLQLSVQTEGTVLLSWLYCCSWLCHLSVGQGWNPNKHSMWEPQRCHHFS